MPYHIINYNSSNMLKGSIIFHNSIVIIDESHNITSSPKNINSWILLKKICKSNCKLILLSGTPINEVRDLATISNLCKGTFLFEQSNDIALYEREWYKLFGFCFYKFYKD